MKTHRDLDVWKKSMQLALLVYNESKKLPIEENYSLGSQIRRSAISIPSNIAEGSARQHKKEIIQFLYISLGSVSEMETQLILIKDLGYRFSTDEIMEILVPVRMMLLKLIKYHKSKLPK